MIDTEGYELRRLPWWYSPLTGKQVHLDAYSMLSYWRWVVEADVIRFLRERGFVGEEYLLLEGEFDRGELEEREGMFRIDQTKPVTIRRYPLDIDRIPEFYTPRLLEEELLTAYTIVEKLKLMRIYLTFSIETGAGNEPFFAEVTCDSVMSPDLPEDERHERIRRIVNGVLKLFFIIFDGNKLVRTADKRDRERDPSWLVRTLMYLQRHADPIYEGAEPGREEQRGGMDGFLDMLMDRIEARPVDDYLTRESVITIGVEYESTADVEYEYPEVHAVIEKVRIRRWHQERVIVLAPSTAIWIDRTLSMVITWTERERTLDYYMD